MKFFAKKLSVLVFPDLIFIEGTFRCHKLKFQYLSEFLQKKRKICCWKEWLPKYQVLN